MPDSSASQIARLSGARPQNQRHTVVSRLNYLKVEKKGSGKKHTLASVEEQM
jgi:hypothetical protein